MNKIIIEVHVPAIDFVYDAKVPRDIQVWEVTKLLSEMVAALHPGQYTKENPAVLCDYETGQMLPVNELVGESGLVNGARVLLV
jgi:hypothetical protein